jgi:hypothetical protein
MSFYSSNQGASSSLLGPGTYEPKIVLTKERSPSALIVGSEERSGVRPDGGSSPLGPGEHTPDLLTFGKDAIKIAIHHKVHQASGNRNPGPGAYYPEPTREKSPEYTMGQKPKH